MEPYVAISETYVTDRKISPKNGDTMTILASPEGKVYFQILHIEGATPTVPEGWNRMDMKVCCGWELSLPAGSSMESITDDMGGVYVENA